MSYNKNTDYQSLIDKATASGDTASAAKYEAARNEKIADMNRAGTNYGGYAATKLFNQPAAPSRGLTYAEASTAQGDYEYKNDFQAMIDKIKNSDINSGNWKSPGVLTDSAQEQLFNLESRRNAKLALSGNANQQTSNYGGRTYESYNGQYEGLNGGTVKTNYIDKNGNSQSGVTSTAMDYYNNMLSKLESQHQSAIAANDATYAAQLEQAMANIQKQKDALNLSYDNAAKQLYIDRRKTEKTTPQTLAAQGYNGGLTESSLLGIQSGYEQNLLNNEQNRTTGLSDLSYEGINQQSQNAIAKAQAAADLENNYYTNYANVMAQLASQQNYENEQAYQQQQDTYARLLQEKQLAASQQSAAQENYQNALSYVVSAKKAGYGVTAAQLAAAFGLSQSDAASLISSAGSVGSSSGSGSYAYTGNDNTEKNIAANISSINDYDTAVTYMKNSGVSSGIRSGIMTRNEWARRKASLNKYGTGSAEVNNYDSYKAYVQDYVQYAVNK